MAEYKKIYEDELCRLFLGMEEFGLSFHADFYETPKPSHIRHYQDVFEVLCQELVERGFMELYTEVEDYEQYTFAQGFGFVDQGLIVSPKDDPEIHYQLMKKDLD